MTADYSRWVERWQAAIAACERLGGDNQSLTVAPPATPDEVAAAEKTLGIELPSSFRAALLEFSAHVEMYWFLPDDQEPPTELKEIFSGDGSWGLQRLLQAEESRRNWVEVAFINQDDLYDLVWHNKLGFAKWQTATSWRLI
ncbi:MAG: SMI1/KNR4 family protein [Armatimonadetes bacterium]|nr:SMI1/KNR4 family protein [Armatimonadota bacterium]